MMIDSEKLMGRMESKGTVLSEKSISNVGVIRRKLVDIDGMLKDKLVLAKVKEGIRRQEEERLKRVEREDGIEESDDDRDIDMDGEKSKRKKPKPGGPSNASSILGPVGAILAGGGLALIAKNLGTFRVTAQILKGIGSGALITFMGAATAINAGYKVVNAIETKTLQMFGDKGLQTLKQFQKVFSTFVNVAVVTAVTAGGASVLGKTRKGLFPGRFKRPKFKSNEIAGITDLTTPIKKPIIKLRRGNINLDKLKEGRNIKKTKSTSRRVKVTADKNVKGAKAEVGGGQTNILRGKNLRKKTPLETVVKQAAENNPGEFFDATGNINVTDPSTREALQSALKKDGTSAREISERVSKMNPDQRRIFFGGSGMDDEGVGAPRGTKPTSSKIDPNQTLFDKMFKNVRTGKGGMGIEDPFGNIKSENFFEDPRGGPGAMKINKTLLKQRGGIVKILSNIGGDAFVESFKQGLKGSFGIIPILGDVIGFLLDYYVFGESPGRAAFKAIGSFALSSLIGAVGLAVGGPVGAFAGGMLGGIGGDILGGIAYDLFFGTEGGVSAKSSATKGVLKGAATQFGLSGGGLVPAALLSMNNGGSVPDIGYSASYDRPGAGSVRFIPIPITSSSDTGSTTRSSGGVIVTKRKRSQPSLYAGGLIT